MQTKLHFRGVWFLPEQKERQINGLLDFDTGTGIDLQLLGTLTDRDDMSNVPVICGITSDGNKITLYCCFPYHRGFNSNGLETSSFEALYLLKGLLLPEKELIFDNIAIRFRDFDRWLKIYGFRKVEYKKESKETIVEYKQPEDMSFSIGDSIKCDISFATYAPIHTSRSAVTVEQVCYVVLSHKEQEKDFDTLYGLFHTFRIFLMLAYFDNPLIDEIVLRKAISSERGTAKKRVELYFKPSVVTATYKKKESPRQFLFTYQEIKSNFENILTKWFESEKELSPAIYGLAEAFSKKDTALEFSFLNIAHAIETLHRRKRKNFVLSKNAYKALVNEIINQVDPKHAEWLRAKLEFSNEPTLQERLEELISELPHAIRASLLKPSEAGFVKDFKRSRNYYTHYSKTLERKALKGNGLFYLAERSKILLICILLKELGFTKEELEGIVFDKGIFLFNHIITYEEVENYRKGIN